MHPYTGGMIDTTQHADPAEIAPGLDRFIRLDDIGEQPWMPVRPDGSRISTATTRGWYYKGARGRKLRTVLIGGIRHTTRRWLLEFFQIDESPAPTDQSPPRTPTQRVRARERAARDLEADGIV